MIETGLGPSTHLHRLVHIVVTMVTSLAVLLVVTMQRPLTIAKFEMVKTTLIHASLKLKLINSIFIWKTTPPPKKNQKHTHKHTPLEANVPHWSPPPNLTLFKSRLYIRWLSTQLTYCSIFKFYTCKFKQISLFLKD